MKKIISLTTLLLLLAFCVNAQQLSKGNSMINLGLGIESEYVTGSETKITFPQSEGSYEIMINDNISIGAFIGYFATEYDDYGILVNNADDDLTYLDLNYLFGGVLGNYHFVNTDKFNAYAGGKLGYSKLSASFDVIYQNAGFGINDSEMIYDAHIGGRYFLSDGIALNAELGFGISLLKVGITFKL